MKDLLNKIFNRIKTSGSTIIDTNYLRDNSWFHVTQDINHVKTVYIFRNNGDLLVSRNGEITKAKWENLTHSTNSLIIDIADKSQLFNILYLTSEYLVIQKDGTDSIEVFIKQQRYQSKLPKELAENTIEFVFRDLNENLNQGNKQFIKTGISTPITKSIGIESKSDAIVERPRKPTTKRFFNLKNDSFEVVNKIQQRIESHKNTGKLEIFDYIDELNDLKERGIIKINNEETAFIIEMQRIEEILIEDGLYCMNCKSLCTMQDGICTFCNPEFPVEEIHKLMEEYSITFNNWKFKWANYRYTKFIDALNYARLKKDKDKN